MTNDNTNTTKTVRELAREMSPDAFNMLVTIMNYGDTNKVKLDASKAILDFAFGPATRIIELPREED